MCTVELSTGEPARVPARGPGGHADGVDLDAPGLHLRPRLRAAGFTDKEVRRRLDAGDLHPLRRGAYVRGTVPDDPAERHLLLVRAALGHLTGPAVLSHASAAVLLGLPLWAVPLDRVHVVRDRRRSGGRRGRRMHVHAAPLDECETTVVAGVTVTSVARTVADLARTLPFEQAVVVADAALARGLVDPAGLDAALARSARWPGCPGARRAVAFADGRSESVGESRSRVAIARAGLPAPVPQWEVTAAGVLVGRVDFGWPELRTVGEFDGRVKYGRLLRPGESPADAVYREKLREDALRAEDLGVVRWGWADLGRFDGVAARLRRRFRPT